MKNEKVVLIGLNSDYYTHYFLTKNIELIEEYKINDFNIDEITYKNEEEAKEYLNKILKSYKYNIESYSVEDKNEKIKIKKLMGWNGYYGFMPFEICIAYGETLEEKKAYYESIGYKCWVEED